MHTPLTEPSQEKVKFVLCDVIAAHTCPLALDFNIHILYIHLNNVKVSAAAFVGCVGRRRLKRSGVASWRQVETPASSASAASQQKIRESHYLQHCRQQEVSKPYKTSI